MATNFVKYKRPKTLTIISVIGFIWVLISFPAVFSPELKRLGSAFPAMAGLLIAASFISLIGVWHMKKWGVEMFIITASLRTLFFFSINDPTFVGTTLSIVFIAFFVAFYTKMDRNL